MIANHQKKWLRRIFITLTTLSIFSSLAFIELNGKRIEVSDLTLFFNNLEHASNAASQFKSELLFPITIALIFPIISCIYGHFHLRKSFKIEWPVILLLVSSILSFGIIWKSTSIKNSFPEPFRLIELSLYAVATKMYNGPRAAVKVNVKEKAIAPHLVWIIDESVRGDLLEINNGPYPNTPFLQAHQEYFINFGVASSAAICSDYSNIILMSGLNENQFPDSTYQSLKRTSIFQYASNAGYATNFINGQSSRTGPDGFMTSFDLHSIDYHWQTWKKYPQIEKHETDFYSIKILKDIIRSQNQSYSYLIKYGSHFHYENAYPKNRKVFTPTTDINNWTKNDKQKLLNSYNNSILWSVDYFFETLIDSLKNENVLIIYTSDHGQNLNEIEGISLTHCLKDKAPSNMAAVPLFIFSPNKTLIAEIKKKYNNELSQRINNSSHFDIFSTTLKLMGYSPSGVDSVYSPSLIDDSPNRNRMFSSGDLFGRNKSFLNKFNYPFESQ